PPVGRRLHRGAVRRVGRPQGAARPAVVPLRDRDVAVPDPHPHREVQGRRPPRRADDLGEPRGRRLQPGAGMTRLAWIAAGAAWGGSVRGAAAWSAVPAAGVPRFAVCPAHARSGGASGVEATSASPWWFGGSLDNVILPPVDPIGGARPACFA